MRSFNLFKVKFKVLFPFVVSLLAAHKKEGKAAFGFLECLIFNVTYTWLKLLIIFI